MLYKINSAVDPEELESCSLLVIENENAKPVHLVFDQTDERHVMLLNRGCLYSTERHAPGATVQPQPHPHAQGMVEYAKDALQHPEPWKRWECRTGNEEWSGPLATHPTWQKDYLYRRIPMRIMCNEVEVAYPIAPGSHKLDLEGRTLYMPDLYAVSRHAQITFDQFDDMHVSALRNGLLYTDELDAVARCSAMMITRGQLV